MTEVFADTFYWLALLNPDDSFHQLAIDKSPAGLIVTTWAVQIEVMDALCQEKLRPLAIGFWQASSDDPNLAVVRLDVTLLEKSAALFAQRQDKNWSLTDCISFEVMRERGITAALTGDRHFEQAGFQALLRAE